jgi:hypothetical protein
MVIHKFIEEIGEKVLPVRRKSPFMGPFPGWQQQQGAPGAGVQYGSSGAWKSPFSNSFAGAENECAIAIRKYLMSQERFSAPSDLVVFFNDLDDIAILAGTVRDEETRDLIVQATGNIQGVEKVDDRMTIGVRRRWR